MVQAQPREEMSSEPAVAESFVPVEPGTAPDERPSVIASPLVADDRSSHWTWVARLARANKPGRRGSRDS